MTAIAILTLSVLGANPASAPAGGQRSMESMLQDVKTNMVIDQPYTPGATTEIELKPNQSARLAFAKNIAGVTEILYLYEPETLHIFYGYANESHTLTRATARKPTEWRTTRSHGSKGWMHCTNRLRIEDDIAHVSFVAKPMTAAEVDADHKRSIEQRLQKLRKPLKWDESAPAEPVRITIPGIEDPDLTRLRTKYDLDKVVAGASDDYDRLRRLLKWVHDRWSHDGNNTPSKSDPLTILDEAAQGKRFRCVEYSVVLAGCAQALGMPARTLGLKREDVETAASGAGHVVTEVWLASRKKWVFADGQMDAIPEKDGVLLSAVEFQAAFAKGDPGLTIRSSSGAKVDNYLGWVVPYLYYFDTRLDQQLFGGRSDHAEASRYRPQRGAVMLVPKGAKKPTVFQGKTPLRNYTYISSPKAFYAPPTTRPAAEDIAGR